MDAGSSWIWYGMPSAAEATVRLERRGLLIECLPQFRDLRVEALPWGDPAALRRTAEVVKVHPDRTVIRLAHDHQGESLELYVKRYHFTDLRRRLRGTLGWSRARSEWESLRGAQALGIGVSRPILVGFRRLGLLLQESYLVTQMIEGAQPADTVIAGLRGAERRRAIRGLGRVVGALHARGLFHDDLKASHVMLSGGRIPGAGLDGVILLDLYRSVAGRRPTLRQRGVNLAQVYVSLPDAPRTDQARLLAGAMPNGAGTRDERRRLWRSMQKALASRRQRPARRQRAGSRLLQQR